MLEFILFAILGWVAFNQQLPPRSALLGPPKELAEVCKLQDCCPALSERSANLANWFANVGLRYQANGLRCECWQEVFLERSS